MRVFNTGQQRDESGAAVIELMFVVPILVLVMAAVLDLSTYIKCNMALDSAATAATRYCMDNPASADDAQALSEYLATIDPEMGGIGVRVSKGDTAKEAYKHLFYVDESDNAISRQSFCSFQPFSVELTYQTPYKTLVGKSISLAAGCDGSLVATSSKSGVIDRTDGDTW